MISPWLCNNNLYTRSCGRSDEKEQLIKHGEKRNMFRLLLIHSRIVISVIETVCRLKHIILV